MKKSATSEGSSDDQTSGGLQSMMAVSPAIATAWVGLFAEGTRFLAHRLRQDLDTQKALLASTSPTEMLEVQARFFETAIEEYSEEVMRLSGMMLRAAEESVEDAVEGHSVESDDMPV